MQSIYLVRHCKASGQQPEAPLTEEGVRQSEALVEFFIDKEIDYIISSPFERAVSTIRPLALKINVDIRLDDRLSERILSSNDLPDWMDKLKESFSDLDMKLPGGESSQEAMDRGVSVIHELFDRPEERAIVVTHGNLMALILKHFDNRFGFDEWKALSNPDIYVLSQSVDPAEINIKRLWS